MKVDIKVSPKKALLVFFIAYSIIHIFLMRNRNLRADEGTHAIIAVFYKDLIENLKNFHSFQDVVKFGVNYLIKYPKISIYYPPLYHLLLASVFTIHESITSMRILNLLLTILTSFMIYKLAYELFKNDELSFFSSLFFLAFSIIFYYADKIMIDIMQILVFTTALWYYVRMKRRKSWDVKNIFILSLLLAVSLLTKFYSIFLLAIILVDSFFSSKKFFKKMLLSLFFLFLILAPYAYIYYKLRLYRITMGKSMEPFLSNLVYFDIFSNFGFFLGPFVILSLIYFLHENKKSKLFFAWLLIPLTILLYLKNNDPRFAFILFPLYSISCGFTSTKLKERIKTKKNKKLFLVIIIVLLALQLIHDIYSNLRERLYPIDEMMKLVKEKGNILILSEHPIYSSVFIFYGRLNNVPGNMIRPCVLEKSELNEGMIDAWGIKYIIDQNRIVDEKMRDSLGLEKVWERKENKKIFRLFKTQKEVEEVNCNFVCVLGEKICGNQTLSNMTSLIGRNVYLLNR